MNDDPFSEVEPFKIKMVEPLHLPSREERERYLEEAGLNVFLLRGEHIFIDLLTDSGTGAMSDRQWSGLMRGDETYAGSRNFYNLKDAIKDVLGFDFVIPCHQGRGAENVLHSTLIREGDVVPGNTHFDTTKGHIEHKRGTAVDCTIDEAADPYVDHPFKGNIDLGKLEEVYREHGREGIPFTVITATCNSGGGQPVSMENMRAVRELSDEYDIPLCLDGARFAENCHFIRTREEGMDKYSIKDLTRMQADNFEMMTMSSKKDAIVNIGGFIALRTEELYDRVKNLAILFEGFITYGGLAGRDMEAIAVGLHEGVREEYLTYRIGQVAYLTEKLRDMGIPVMWPPGGHAVYLDMKRFLPHIEQTDYPGFAFTAELYLESGVRGVEIGTVLNNRDPETGEDRPAKLELVRLTIPRRVYTHRHLDYVARAVKAVWDRREEVRGLDFTYEAPVLRHFTARFKWKA